MIISIITINYNNRNGLIKTVESVLAQSYTDIEYIVIDGKSTDGSEEIIKNVAGKLAYWVSEEDKGIYHAMNKGVKKATGEYLLFLNSGDTFVDEQVVRKFVKFEPTEAIIYGNTRYVFKDGTTQVVQMPNSLEGLTIFKRTLNHQCIFHKYSVFEDQVYDTSYNILADWAFYNTCVLIKKASYRHIDLLVVNYDKNGMSSQPENESIMEQDRMLFYSRNVDKLIPMMLTEYERLQRKHERLQRKYDKLKNNKVVRRLLKVRAVLKRVFK